MTEEEARKALFQVHYEYMMHPPKERLKLYDEYKKKRDEIKHELAKTKWENKEKQLKKE